MLTGIFVHVEIFTVFSKRMLKFSAVLMDTERSGICLLAEADIHEMLLLLRTLKVVQLHALLAQTNPWWLQGSSESSWLFCVCIVAVVCVVAHCFWGIGEAFSPETNFWTRGESYKNFYRRSPVASV